MTQSSSVCCLDGRGSNPDRAKELFIFSASRPSLGITQVPVEWVPGVKRGRSVMLTAQSPSSAEVKIK
jgi:hypothetical protein